MYEYKERTFVVKTKLIAFSDCDCLIWGRKQNNSQNLLKSALTNLHRFFFIYVLGLILFLMVLVHSNYRFKIYFTLVTIFVSFLRFENIGKPIGNVIST